MVDQSIEYGVTMSKLIDDVRANDGDFNEGENEGEADA